MTIDNKPRHTPGPWRFDSGLNVLAGKRVVANCNSLMSSDDDTRPENTANAQLIAEAGTIASETGLSPRELAEQREELLGALEGLLLLCENANRGAFENGVTDPNGTIDEGNVYASRFMGIARAAIRKAKG